VDHQNEMGKSVAVNSCGLSVHSSMPWLAAGHLETVEMEN